MTENIEPWERLKQIAEIGDADQLEQYIEGLGARETVRVIFRLGADDRKRVLTTLHKEEAAELIEEMPAAGAAELIEQLSPIQAAPIVNEMESNDAADLIGELDKACVLEILQEMEPLQAEDAQRLASYPSHVAGGIMITEFMAYPEQTTVREVIRDLRENADDYGDYTVQYVFVISRDKKLTGVLPLRDLLLSKGETAIQSIMIRDPHYVNDYTPLDRLAEYFELYPYIGAPVLDKNKRMVGLVKRADVQEALGERSTDDYLKSRGIVGGEELRSMPLLKRSGRRLSWLSINIILNIIAASVIALYQDTLHAVIALAVFLPIISDMSGCSGNQAVAVSMRELALGLVKPAELIYVWLKEASVGVINGIALGVLIALAALLWKGNPFLGLVVGGAMALNTIVAVSLGGVLPLVLKRYKMDPALASGPILTTVTDMCGFFLILSFATLCLPLLTV